MRFAHKPCGSVHNHGLTTLIVLVVSGMIGCLVNVLEHAVTGGKITQEPKKLQKLMEDHVKGNP